MSADAMKEMFQPNLPVMPVHRVDRPAKEGEAEVQKMDGAMSFEQSREITAAAVRRAIRGHAYKEFGDASAVMRWCKGLDNPNLARLFQDQDVREELVFALAEGAGLQVQRVVVGQLRRRR